VGVQKEIILTSKTININMKKILTSLLLTSSLLFGNNEIYLDQSGNTGTFTIVQYGSQNKIGSASKRSELTGESKLYDLVFTGDSNTYDATNKGNGDTVNFFVAGNNNDITTNFEGDSNTILFDIAGASNSITVAAKADASAPATLTNAKIDLDLQGNQNNFDILLFNTTNALDTYLVRGDNNTFTSYQEGQTGGTGHEQFIEIFGSSNHIDIAQVGSENNNIDLTIAGSNNIYTIIQTDGTAPTYTAATYSAATVNP